MKNPLHSILKSCQHHRAMFTVFLLCMVSSGTLATPIELSDAFTNTEIREIDEFCAEVMSCGHIPGLSVGVVRGDYSFSTGHGVADMNTAHPVGKGTMFTLGSTAKAFVPYILAEIMNGKENKNGRLRWSSTLQEILRDNFSIDVPEPWANLTLRDILIYKSGSSAADLSTMAGLPRDVTREELIKRMRFLPKTKEFKRTNHYSNYMYTVAAHLAEKFSGMGWEELVKARVLDKQDMNTTSFTPQGLSYVEAALPYRLMQGMLESKEQNLTLFDLQPFEPVGSLMVSARDITKWLRHLLHNLDFKENDTGINLLIGDAFHQSRPLPNTHKEGRVHHDSEVPFGYGMGWYSSNYKGLLRHSYSGGLYAYTSHIWLFPKAQVAIYLAVNGPGTKQSLKAVESILYYLSDLALRQKNPWMTVETACCCDENDYTDYKEEYYYEDIDSAPVPLELKSVQYVTPVEKYIGTYGHGLVGNLEIQEVSPGGALVLKLGRNLRGHLVPSGSAEDKLIFRAEDWLQNTDEWYPEKAVEFMKISMDNSESSFDTVRLHLTDSLFYDFERDRDFKSMLYEQPTIIEVQVLENITTTSASTIESSTWPTTTKKNMNGDTMNNDNTINTQESVAGHDDKEKMPGYTMNEDNNLGEAILEEVKTPDQNRRDTGDESLNDNHNSSMTLLPSCFSLALVLTFMHLWA